MKKPRNRVKCDPSRQLEKQEKQTKLARHRDKVLVIKRKKTVHKELLIIAKQRLTICK